MSEDEQRSRSRLAGSPCALERGTEQAEVYPLAARGIERARFAPSSLAVSRLKR